MYRNLSFSSAEVGLTGNGGTICVFSVQSFTAWQSVGTPRQSKDKSICLSISHIDWGQFHRSKTAHEARRLTSVLSAILWYS